MKKLLIIAAVLLTLVIGISQVPGQQLVHPHAWTFVLFNMALFVYGHDLRWAGEDNEGLAAFNAYLRALVIRFLAVAGCAAVYIWKSGQTKDVLIIATLNFFLIYLIFVIAEVSAFLANLRRNSAGHGGSDTKLS